MTMEVPFNTLNGNHGNWGKRIVKKFQLNLYFPIFVKTYDNSQKNLLIKFEECSCVRKYTYIL